ncbi:MAG: 50S ribosomal protein L21 [Ruminococcus sp.]|jgi:large subunit ribosomal protein L21|nr:50S ribosomal protein L21 [Ruminococcus sp.]
MYAVIETGGKQYQVKEGDEIYIEKLGADTDAAVTFDKVILVSGDDGIKTGKPYVEGAVVEAVVVKNGKGKKINIFTYHSKEGSTYHRQGHRQPYTKVRIESVKA